jgi:hypothetical protein
MPKPTVPSLSRFPVYRSKKFLASVQERLGSLKHISPLRRNALAFLAILGLLATRRWQQLVLPQLWVEDGTQLLSAYIDQGWAALFVPVNGYLVVVPKIISAISVELSFSNLPIISTIIAWLFIAFVGMAIALSPTKLKWRMCCAISVFFIPSAPEVFGVPLYTFWWSALLLFLVVLWDEKAAHIGWRIVFLLLGGLSSPVIVAVLPVLYLRSCYLYKSLKSERVITFIATLIAAIQLYFVLSGSSITITDSTSPLPLLTAIKLIVPKFMGTFMVGNWNSSPSFLWVEGTALLALIVAWLASNYRTAWAWILVYLLLISIAMAATRIDLREINQCTSGPRYFFFPYILTFWILIQYFYGASKTVFIRTLIGVAIASAITNSIPVWSQDHADLRWKDHVHSAGLFDEYDIPIQYDRSRTLTWHLQVSGENCAALLARDMLYRVQPTYPYRVRAVADHVRGEPGAIALISNTMTLPDYHKSQIPGHRVIGSLSGADTGALSLKLRRGDEIFYRSRPITARQSVTIVGLEHEFLSDLPQANRWVRLSFSNSKLPPEFVVIIEDGGRAAGEGSAIAIPE